jgi:hypothetical protein
MKIKIPLVGLAVALAAGGCASVPEPGSLVYYDAGCLWWWRDGCGWQYLGERRFRMHDHVPVPEPGQAHLPPGGDHHPPPPGTPPPSGGQNCYFFVASDGSVLKSQDGEDFWPLGYFDEYNEYLPEGAGARGVVPFRGKLLSSGGSFRVASTPAAAFRTASERVLFGSGGTGGGGFYRGGGGSSYERGNSSGSSARSGGFSGGGGWSGGGGGGGRSFSGGGGGSSGGGRSDGGRGGGGGDNRR